MRTVAFLCFRVFWCIDFSLLYQRSEITPFLVELGKSVLCESVYLYLFFGIDRI